MSTLDTEGARTAADNADQHLTSTGEPIGPLHGPPMTVKDALEVKGMSTTSLPRPHRPRPRPGRHRRAPCFAQPAPSSSATNVPTMCQDVRRTGARFLVE
ncbi:amidase family protein [Streptomyces sp. NBC_01643]|uniref:amidase family protein n=1 Tax=Streptomyces sp. NBC_01643 TaxID=2975906 RepID=UPI00386B3AC6|nr:amidase [Streptomyces sp. NBC_01643]